MSVKKSSALLATLLLPLQGALAHEGHGLPGVSHWHPTDIVGLLLAAGLVVLAIWLARGGK
jgi:hypothetical protein